MRTARAARIYIKRIQPRRSGVLEGIIKSAGRVINTDPTAYVVAPIEVGALALKRLRPNVSLDCLAISKLREFEIYGRHSSLPLQFFLLINYIFTHTYTESVASVSVVASHSILLRIGIKRSRLLFAKRLDANVDGSITSVLIGTCHVMR